MRLIPLSAACAIAMTVAACTTTQPASAPGLESVLGATLIGVKGKTRADQKRLSIRNARECAAGFWPAACP